MLCVLVCGYSDIVYCFFFNDTATTEIYTLSLHDALPIFLTDGRTNPDRHHRYILIKRKARYHDQLCMFHVKYCALTKGLNE